MMITTPDSERPRERCLTQGPSCLSLRECLALIIGSGPKGLGCLGLAQEILSKPGLGLMAGSGSEKSEEVAFFAALEGTPLTHFKGIRGLGAANQARLLAAFELARRYSHYRDRSAVIQERPLQKRPALPEAALDRVDFRARCEPREWLGFVPVHRSGELGELCVVERGARTHVNVEPGELFAQILAFRPRGFFLFHNHPSGDLTPSLPDVDLTTRVQQLGEQLGLKLYGHAVVTARGERWVVI
jgi:DNA repair protein RadC